MLLQHPPALIIYTTFLGCRVITIITIAIAAMLSKIDENSNKNINISNAVFVKRKGRRKRRLLEGNLVVFVKRKGRRKNEHHLAAALPNII